MTAIPHYSHFSSGLAVAFNTTTYVLNSNTASTTETDRKLIWRTPGTMSGLRVYVTANTITTSATTFRTRKNTANGGQSVSIGAGLTGTFEDLSGSDALAAGDLFNFQVVTPNTSGSITVKAADQLFAATTDSAVRYTTRNATSFAAGGTTYSSLAGGVIGQATEAAGQIKMKAAGTLKNLFTRIVANSTTGPSTLKTRKGGANGNLAISIGAGLTGAFEDTSNSDAVAVNDLWCTQMIIGAGGSGLSTIGIVSAVDFVITSNVTELLLGTGGQINANLTRYQDIYGNGENNATESAVQVKALAAMTLSLLNVTVQVNTVSAASTVRTRIGGADGTNVVSITASTTGYFEDATPHNDLVAAGDLINLKIITGATGTALQPGVGGMAAAMTISVAGTQATETDTGNAGALAVTRPGTQATETNAANAGTPLIVTAGARASETDAGSAGTPRVTTAGARADETDTAAAGAAAVVAVGSVGTEADASATGTPAVTVAGRRADESESGAAGAPQVTVAGASTTETDAGGVGGAALTTVGQRADEPDSATAGTPRVTVAGASSSEASDPNGGTATVAQAGVSAAETDTGAHGTAALATAGQRATETDTGDPGAVTARTAGQRATETDAGTAGRPLLVVAGATGSETDTATGAAGAVTAPGTRADETDTAAGGARTVGVTGGQAQETDEANGGSTIDELCWSATLAASGWSCALAGGTVSAMIGSDTSALIEECV